jgi:hypothetical protein
MILSSLGGHEPGPWSFEDPPKMVAVAGSIAIPPGPRRLPGGRTDLGQQVRAKLGRPNADF